jgi:hypothetical protein
MKTCSQGLALSFLLSGAAWVGCSESDTSSPNAAAPGGGVTTADASAGGRVPAAVAAILTMGCARMECHGNPGPMSYATATSQFTRLAGMTLPGGPCAGRPRMVPGNATESLIIRKVQPEGPYPCGAKMPLGCNGTGAQRCLTPEEIATLAAWIDAGARSE